MIHRFKHMKQHSMAQNLLVACTYLVSPKAINKPRLLLNKQPNLTRVTSDFSDLFDINTNINSRQARCRCFSKI